ncbi:hypothetical protein [Asaia platycodi]|uniref:hypothetical protein n=1 Tax=Asaia platycodi TaxID=610243 RepID=UPI0005564332|nr:hypothetical protein [Asaia platycodi]
MYRPGLETVFGVAGRTACSIEPDLVDVTLGFDCPLRVQKRGFSPLHIGRISRLISHLLVIARQIVDNQPAQPNEEYSKDCRHAPHRQRVEALGQSVSFFHYEIPRKDTDTGEPRHLREARSTHCVKLQPRDRNCTTPNEPVSTPPSPDVPEVP